MCSGQVLSFTVILNQASEESCWLIGCVSFRNHSQTVDLSMTKDARVETFGHRECRSDVGTLMPVSFASR